MTNDPCLRALLLLGVTVGAAATARADDAARPAAGQASAIETRSSTHAGEGSVGVRRVFRNGCYQSEGRGSPGGGGDVHDSEAGCADASLFGDVFAQADALIVAGVLVPERPSAAGAAEGAARGRRSGLGDREDTFPSARSVVIDGAGRRLVPKDAEAAKRLAAVVYLEPTIDAWYVTPPRPPRGGGPQLIALSARSSGRAGSRMLQASLVATGAWWCHLTVPAEASDEAQSFTRPAPRPLTATKATAILGRVLAGISERALADGEAKGVPSGDDALGVEAAVGGGPRTAVRSRAAAAGAAIRFGAEMRAQSTACSSP